MSFPEHFLPSADPPAAVEFGVVELVPGKSEADKAADLKERARKLLIELCALMDEGMRDGLLIRWQNIAVNSWGHHEVVDLHVMKRF